MSVSYDFSGKVALVTAANTGLAVSTAIQFAKSGASVVVSGQYADSQLTTVANECRNTGARVFEIAADPTREEDMRKLVDKTISTFGRIDILVNCPIYPEHNPIGDPSLLWPPESAYCMARSGFDMFTKCMATELGPKGIRNPSTINGPSTDSGSVQTFKYPFSFAKVVHYSGGWTREVSARELPIAKQLSGVQMRLISGGVRELHWHITSEWAYVISGTCRITAVDQQGRAFVEDVSESDLWLFPGGIPHSLQDETDLLKHIPLDVLAKNFDVPKSTFANLPQNELYIFASDLPRPLEVEQRQAAQGTGFVPESYAFFASQMFPNVTRLGGEVKIIDKNNFPVTTTSAAIVTLKPGGLREIHWHPLGDEWTYIIKGWNIILQDKDLHKSTNYYEDVSLAVWLAHTPSRLVNEHIHSGE
ncbi:unnamed protein product, partial [Oppiella nova]